MALAESLAARKAALLDQALALSKRRQELAVEVTRVEQEMLKAAGAIDLIDSLITASTESKPDGE